MTETKETLKTALYQNHIDHGAKTGPFAGYDMPLYYKEGVIKEHEWVRTHAGLFDVSHMGQAMIRGPEGGTQCREFVEKITPSSFEKLKIGRTKYTVLTNPEGGIVDDLMVTHCDDNAYHFVLNAGCKAKDIDWIKSHLPGDIDFIYFDEWALMAIQGPDSEDVVKATLGLDLSDMPYMAMRALNDNKMFISRLGYTGEDGFEIAVHNNDAPDLWEKLLSDDRCKPIGLAARDGLRLEMGYPLYGHDIDDTTTPVEADLNWIIGKDNKTFIGHGRVWGDLEKGITRKRVGIELQDRGIAREGTKILDVDGKEIGTLTSGGFSPILQKSIGMGYVNAENAQMGNKVFLEVRNKRLEAIVGTLSFIEPKTKSMKVKQAA